MFKNRKVSQSAEDPNPNGVSLFVLIRLKLRQLLLQVCVIIRILYYYYSKFEVSHHLNTSAR